MRVFVAGASGAIGRPLVRRLVAAGHDVTGMSRSEERARRIREDGARAVVCDVFDAAALRTAVGDSRAEVVVHQLTDLARLNPRRPDYAATNRLRTVGTRNLVEAASWAGARRLVAQSIAFVYAPTEDSVKSEDAPLDLDAPGALRGAVAAVHDLEDQVARAPGMTGIVLRYGFFYGPGTVYARDGSFVAQLRRRRLPQVGAGSGIFSFIHVDDAAAATVAAVERGTAGVYNIVDDDPAPMSEWLRVMAEVIGAPRPMRVPAWLARLVTASDTVRMALVQRGAGNAKAKRELGWTPQYASWREGFAAELG